MKTATILVCALLLSLILAPVSIAGDFDWIKDFNIKAEVDPSGFKAKLEARFNIGSTEVNAVLSTVDDPADAYIVFRLGEMSGQPTKEIIRKYKSGKGKGWGVLAKSLGIKPGSKEFKALKNGDGIKEKQYTYKTKNKENKSKKKNG